MRHARAALAMRGPAAMLLPIEESRGETSMLQGSVVRAVFGSALLALASGSALAQGDFPSRPITLVVPLPAGGTADLLCRYAAEKASAALGQQVVVENRAGGAGGRIGMEQV